MASSRLVRHGFRISGAQANWTVEDGLTVADAAELRDFATKVLTRTNLKSLHLELPETGLRVTTYQVLRALVADFEKTGRSVSVNGNFAPWGGRHW